MRSIFPRLILLSLLALCSTLTIACDDDDTGSGNTNDTTSGSTSGDTSGTSGSTSGSTSGTTSGDTSGSTSGTTLPPGNFKIESENPAAEFPDCINDCVNASTTIDGVPKNRQEVTQLKVEGFDGYAGKIDGNCHDLLIASTPSKGPDIDILTLEARARTVVEFIVEPTGTGLAPTIYTHDGTQTLTFGGGEAGQTARTVFAVPNLGFLPFFVIIEDDKNAGTLGAGGPFIDCSGFVGGDNYGYVVRINTLPFAPVDVTSGATTSHALSTAGDIIYFKFMAPSNASPTITLQSTSTNERFSPALAIMNTAGGQLAWESIRYDGAGRAPADGTADGTVSYQGPFITCASNDPDCLAGDGEFIFAILDWNGRGGADFTFTVTASW
jgi:hypothetical protein